MKRMNLKKEYEIREMNQKEMDEMIKENGYSIRKFEDEEDFMMIHKNKKNLFIIHLIDSENSDNSEKSDEKSEKQIHIPRDRDIKIDSKKIEDFGIKLIYHRDSKGEKEYRIFISFKENGKLIRKRLRNQKIDENSRNEEKMKEIYDKISLEDLNILKAS